MKITTTGSPEEGGRKRGRRSFHEQATGQLGPAMNPAMAALLSRGVERYLFGGRKITQTRAYVQTLQDYFSDGYELKDGVLVPVLKSADQLPSFCQFRYIYRKVSRSKII